MAYMHLLILPILAVLHVQAANYPTSRSKVDPSGPTRAKRDVQLTTITTSVPYTFVAPVVGISGAIQEQTVTSFEASQIVSTLTDGPAPSSLSISGLDQADVDAGSAQVSGSLNGGSSAVPSSGIPDQSGANGDVSTGSTLPTAPSRSNPPSLAIPSGIAPLFAPSHLVLLAFLLLWLCHQGCSLLL
jgi:hypothetical protein